MREERITREKNEGARKQPKHWRQWDDSEWFRIWLELIRNNKQRSAA